MDNPCHPTAPASYDDAGAYPKPRFKLWRTWLKQPRPTKHFAPRLSFNPIGDAPPPESAAHWGEHIIIEDNVTVLHRDGTSTWRVHFVTQVAGANELAGWDELWRSYDIRTEKQRIVLARLMTPEGGWRKASQKVHTVPAPGTSGNVYGRAIQLGFHPLRPGVIVELEETYDRFRVDQFGPTIANQIYLRTGTPCSRRRFTMAVARPFTLNYQLHHGAPPPVERQVGEYRVYTWEVTDAEGVEVDDWTPPPRDYVPWIDVSTTKSWSPFAAQFRKELEPASIAGHDIREIADDLSRDKATPLEKAAAAYTYVAKNVRYGRPPAESFGRNIRSAEVMLQDLRGDCKDKSALLVQLLRSMRMDARIAVVLTGDSGRTPFLPSARFNHALVRLEHEEQVYWLDAAGGPFAFGDLPNIDVNISALVLGKDGFTFDYIRPIDDGSRAETRHCEGKLHADGSYEFAVETRLGNESGARLRMALIDRTEKHRLRVLQSWLGADYPGCTGSDFTYAPVEDLAKSFSYRSNARLERVARRIKDLYLIRIPWSAPLSMSGPLAATERSSPLIVPPYYHAIDRHVIALPTGVLPYATPDPVTHECEWGRYRCHIEADDGRLVCERELRLAGNAVPAERFGEYQEFWRGCSWADGAEVVLRSVHSLEASSLLEPTSDVLPVPAPATSGRFRA